MSLIEFQLLLKSNTAEKMFGGTVHVPVHVPTEMLSTGIAKNKSGTNNWDTWQLVVAAVILGVSGLVSDWYNRRRR